ncbi:VPS4-associated 1 protein [Rutstroemia sp. NJR-2017a BVV2]|nr:VPS4-associated 1 protein [Rutstroemia sp. NJR-2017a BVV2]
MILIFRTRNMASFPNVWTHRKVADTASKSCEICYKPSTSVLITPENKDFFYVCPTHLKDKGFATPIIDEAAIAAKKKKELDDEIERIRQGFEEKQRKRKEKEKEAEKDKEKDEKNKKDGEKEEEKKTDEKSKSETPKSPATPSAQDEEPRVFALKAAFYQQRIDKKRNAEIARRNRERLQNPNLFPQVPKGLP